MGKLNDFYKNIMPAGQGGQNNSGAAIQTLRSDNGGINDFYNSMMQNRNTIDPAMQAARQQIIANATAAKQYVAAQNQARNSILSFNAGGGLNAAQTWLNAKNSAMQYQQEKEAYQRGVSLKSVQERDAGIAEQENKIKALEKEIASYGTDYVSMRNAGRVSEAKKELAEAEYKLAAMKEIQKRERTGNSLTSRQEALSAPRVTGIDNVKQFFSKDYWSGIKQDFTPEKTGDERLDNWSADMHKNANAARMLANTYGVSTDSIGGSLTQRSQNEFDQQYKDLTFGERMKANVGNTALGYGASAANAALTAANTGLAVADRLTGGKASQNQTVQSIYSVANFAQNAASGMNQMATQDMQDASNWLGKLVLNLETTMVEQGIERAVAKVSDLLLPGSGEAAAMAMLGIRTFGSGAQEAEDRGENLWQQLKTGVARGGTEVGTEMLGGIGGSWRGTGYGDAAFKKLDKWVATKTGSELLGTLASAYGSEMWEEILADIVNPIWDRIFGIGVATGRGEDKTFSQKLIHFFEDVWGDGQLLYDGLLGGLAGALGGGGAYIDPIGGMRVQAKNLSVDIATYKAAERIVSSNKMRNQFRELTGVELADDKNTALVQAAAYLTNVSESAGIGAREAESNIFQKIETGNEVRSAQLAEKFLTSTDVASGITNAFGDAAESLNESAREVLEDGFDPRVSSLREYAFGVKDAYMMGSQGFTLEQTIQNSQYAAQLHPDQIRHAWQLGRSMPVTGTGAVDINTEEGKARLQTSLKALGKYADEAVTVYEEGQDASLFGAAMDKLVNLYGANGADLMQAWEDARSGKTNDIIGTLTEAQVKMAQQISEQARQDKAADVKARAEQLQAKAKAQTEGKVQQREKGTVRFDGGVINGVALKGVDQANLNRQQKNVVAMVERLADFVPIDYVFFSGKESAAAGSTMVQTAGVYLQGGTVYINLDATTRGTNKMLAAATLSHELTHFMQQYAPEEYALLKDYVVKTILKKSPAQFDALVRQQQKLEPGKTYDQLVDELVANACQTMLMDDKAVTKMARSDMTLAQKVADVLEDIRQKIHDAVDGLDISQGNQFAPARAVIDEIDAITDLWVNGISKAVETYKAVGSEAGEAQYMKVGERDDGIEVYETSEEIKKLPWKEKRKRFLDLMNNEYRGRTAKFTIGDDVYYAKFAGDDIRKTIYGDKKSDDAGRDAKINAGADGDIFDLVENASYLTSEPERGKKTRAHRNVNRWDYFVKTVQIDGRVFNLLANVRKKQDGEFVYSLQLTLNDNIEAASPDALPNKGELNGAPTASGNNIAETAGEVKKEIDVGSANLEVDTGTDSIDIQYSLVTWEESDYVTDRERAAEDIAKAVGVSRKKALDYIDSVNTVARMIADDKVRLDYADTGRSPFVSNAEYGGSFDFTTLCKKRRLLTGTFSAIQKALANTALTANEILEIRKMMDDAGLEVSCGKCYVEGSRASMGIFTKEFLELYKKYNPGKWAPNMAQMNTPDGIEWVRQTHPEVYEQYEYFWNHYGTLKPGDPNLFASQQKPKLYQMRSAYKGEVLQHFKRDSSIEEKNRNGGVRMQSFSDFEIVHLIDAMQVIMDMSRVGLNGQAYTKVPDFAWALGHTGLKINLSIDAWSVDENGKLVFNNKEGMNFDEAMRIRAANSENVGTICCVYDDAQLLAALADDRIDFIIPFHRSQWKKSQYKAMGLPQTTKDYTYQQNEKWLDPSKHTHEYRGKQVKDKCFNYMPNEYWDFTKSGKENAEEYLRMCARDGKRPKFYKFLDRNADGSFSLKKDGSTDGYWKLLIDFKMYDNDGKGSPQLPVKPNFNMDEVNRMLTSYEGGHSQFPVAQGIVDEFVEKYKAEHKDQAQFQKVDDAAEEDFSSEREPEAQYSKFVDDEYMLDFLNEQVKNGEVVHTYKTFLEVVDKDGTVHLYPPMASMQRDENGKLKMAHSMEVGRWEESVGNPNSKGIISKINKKGETKWYYRLVKDNGKTVDAAYDPYQHSSDVVLNDQFEEAYQRPNLVTYECLIPQSDINSGYWYRQARDDGQIVEAALPAGKHSWKKGTVAGKLKNTERSVYLTKYLMPYRRLSDAEVAQQYKEILGKEDTKVSVPFNVVPPGLLTELEKAGVSIDYKGSPGYQYRQSKKGAQFQKVWDEGEVYNDRALLSEKTLDKWLDAYAASNPKYAQAYIAYMEPGEFLRLTTGDIVGRARIEAEARGLGVDKAVEYTREEQPIFLDIDTENGKVVGHEGRHRMVALQNAGIDKVPVLLFDSANKYSKEPLDILRLNAQSFNGRRSIDSLYVHDLQPLSRGNRDVVADKFSKKKAKERIREEYSGRKTVQFQKLDADYMSAVDTGNMETAQRMVDEAAKAAGYTVRAFHGSPETGITEFDINRAGQNTEAYSDKAIWFTDEEAFAEEMSYERLPGSSVFRNRRGKKGKVYSVYLNTGNTFDIQNMTPEMRQDFYEIARARLRQMGYKDVSDEFIDDQIEAPLEYGNDQLVKFYIDYGKLRELGYDSLKARLYAFGQNNDAVEYGILDNKNIKSADPVTYDDKGNVIPLSERFNREDADIRFQMTEDMAPEIRDRLETGEDLRNEVKSYFKLINRRNSNYLSPEQIEDLMETDPYGNYLKGDMTGADEVMMALSGFAKSLKVSERTDAYELMDKILQHLSPNQKENWVSEKYDVKDKAFLKWYNEKHPSLYYEGYKPGDLNQIGNQFREIHYLEELIQNGGIPLRDMTEARELLTELKYNPQPVYYQMIDNSDEDTETEKSGRELAYARLQNENAILKETVKTLKRTVGKQKTTLANIQKQLQISDPEVRKRDAEKLAKALISETNSTADADKIAAEIKAFGDYLLQTPDFSEQTLKNKARDIAYKIAMGATENVTLDEDTMTVNPYEQYMGEATEEMANRIVMDAVTGVLRPVQATKADKQKSMQQTLKDQLRQLREENKLNQKEAATLYETINTLTEQLDRAQSQYETLRQEAEYRTAQVRAEGAARAAEIRAYERARSKDLLEEQKKHYLDIARRAKARREESAGATKYRKQVIEKAGKLYEMLLKNDDKTHVPEVLKQPLGELLESISFESKRSLAGGAETQADQKFGARLMKLQQMLENQQRYLDGDSDAGEDLGGYIDVSPEMMDYLRNMSELITTAMNTGRTFTVNQMSAEDLKTLSQFLGNLRTAINNMNRFMANARYKSVREAAAQDIEGMKSLGGVSGLGTTAAAKLATWQNGTPYYIFKRYGKGGEAIFDGLTRGWEKLAFNAREIINFTEDLYTDKEVKEWTSQIHDITLEDGTKIQITTGQIMSLAMLINREQALKHMNKGGARIGDIKQKGVKGTIQDLTQHHFTEADLQKIIGTLTARQLEVAQKLQKYMATKGAEWGNEISMRRFGYNFYEEGENYFPIRTMPTDRPMADTDAQQNSMFRLLNLSASKSLNPKANNALVIDDIFDVFSDHMADMAKLNGMGLPILDAIKWFNYKEKLDNGDGTFNTETMQAAMQTAFGDQAGKYFKTLIKDINGMTESGDRGTNLPTKLLSNYKIAAVAANLRVALLQPTAYVRAMTVLSPKYMIGNIPTKAAYEEALKYSGTAGWKDLGYYETDISRGLREKIKHDDTVRDKIAEASMKPAEFGDQMTWATLWQACKRQTKAQNPNLIGNALMQKTADLFREVIYSSQVMDSTLTRSEIMRGKTMFTKGMSAFMAEPTLSYNILMDAFSKYSQDVRKNGLAGSWQRNSAKVGRAFAVYVCSATFAALVESIADAFRDDDDEEFLEKFTQAFFGEDGKILSGNFVQDLSVLGKIPYVKNFISTLQGYRSTDMSVAALTSVMDVYNIWSETIKLANGELEKATKTTYYGKMTEWGKIYKTLQALSQLSGFAVSNASRDVIAIWNTIMNGRRDDWKIRTYDSGKGDSEEDKIRNSLLKGKMTEQEAVKALMDTGKNGKISQITVDKWQWEQETGVQYSKLDDAYKAGEITRQQAVAGMKAAGKSDKDIQKAIEDYDFEKKYGSDYEGYNLTLAQAKAYYNNGLQNKVSLDTYAAQAEEYGTTILKNYYGGDNLGFRNIEDYATFYSAPIHYTKREKAAELVQSSGINLERYTSYLEAADTDGNRSVKQDELGAVLKSAIGRNEITQDEAEKIWYTLWQSKNTYAKWARKH